MDASKDAVQEVFIKLWEKKIHFKHADAAKSYLYTAVKNKSLDVLKSPQLKRLGKSTSLQTIESLASDAFFYKEVVLVETAQIIGSSIESLPAKCAQIIRLTLRNFSNQEIADELSLSINTVKTQKKIAYQKLRPLLKNYRFVLLLLLNS